MDMTANRIETTNCRAVSGMLGRIGDKWTILVVIVLREQPRRFNDIKRHVDGISQQMLTRALKALERDGLVERTVHATKPPQVEYALTTLGQSLSDTARQLARWTEANIATIHANQMNYDSKQALDVDGAAQ